MWLLVSYFLQIILYKTFIDIVSYVFMHSLFGQLTKLIEPLRIKIILQIFWFTSVLQWKGKVNKSWWINELHFAHFEIPEPLDFFFIFSNTWSKVL